VLKRHRLRYLGIGGVLLALAPTLIAAQEPVIRGPIGQRLDSLLQAAEAQGFHGSALVAQHDTVLLLTGYGFANEETHTRYTAVTLVQIGSNVKDFTKVAIYQLLEQGRLHLTDSLPLFLDGVAESKRRITIEQLLDHTAGLPLGLTPDATPVTKAEMLERLNALPLASSPGTRRAYSNLGYSMLAVIIERVSSQPYDTYVAENILRPAEMLETGTYLPRFDRARIAHGYEGSRDVGGILDMPHDADGHLWALRGNGGYLSTLNDMRRFYRALRGPGLLADEAHRRAVVSTANPQVLAGSDMRSFFLFGNFPGADVEIFLASNHSAYKASRLLEPIEQVMGIQVPSGGSQRLSAPLVERLPDTGVGHTITALSRRLQLGGHGAYAAVLRGALHQRPGRATAGAAFAALSGDARKSGATHTPRRKAIAGRHELGRQRDDRERRSRDADLLGRGGRAVSDAGGSCGGGSMTGL
jgi:CubicO group peptidase (beta-lactamase class C family)